MIPLSDLLLVVGIAAGCSLVVAALGLLVLRRLRSATLTSSLLVVVAASIGAVVAGALGTAWAMFLSPHDLVVLLLVCAVAGPVGLAAAWILGRAVVEGSAALGIAVRGLGEGAYGGTPVRLSAELAALDRQMARTSEDLRTSRERERMQEQSRQELVAWVSHDLRTPLAGLRAMSEALEDRVVVDPPTVHRYHERMRIEVDRLAEMIDDLFALSRINASALRLTLHDVSLEDVVSDAIASAAPVAAARGVRLVAPPPSGLPPIEGSVPELGRVLRNVLSNAIRHTPSDGVVSVQTRSEVGTALIEVADMCGGIPADELPRVFDVAFRGSSARPADGGGGGLGLAIARGLMKAHRGDISIENVGPGCRVLLRLPALTTAGVGVAPPGEQPAA